MFLTKADVSVVVTAHNETNFEVNRAISSVVLNGISEANIFLVVDGKKKFQLKNRGVKKAVNRAGGVSESRNIGLDAVQTQLIAFLDADDEWLENKISSQLAVLNSSAGIKLVTCGFFENYSFVCLRRLMRKTDNKYTNFIPLSGALFFKPSFRFRDVVNEDHDFFLNFDVNEISVCPDYLFVKNQISGSRGGNRLGSVMYSSSNSVPRALTIVGRKLTTITGAEIYWKKIIIFILFKAFVRVSDGKKHKSAIVRVRPLTSEGMNALRFSRRYQVKTITWADKSSKKLTTYCRRCFFVSAGNTFTEAAAGCFADFFFQFSIVYFANPAARVQQDIFHFLRDDVITCHLLHGRVGDEKMRVNSNYSLSKFNKSEVTGARRNFCFPFDMLNVSFTKKVGRASIIFFHGYEKGSSYGLRNLFTDRVLIKKLLNNVDKILILPHPTAWLFRIYVSLLDVFSRRVCVVKPHDAVEVSHYYSTSPTYSLYYKKMRYRSLDPSGW